MIEGSNQPSSKLIHGECPRESFYALEDFGVTNDIEEYNEALAEYELAQEEYDNFIDLLKQQELGFSMESSFVNKQMLDNIWRYAVNLWKDLIGKMERLFEAIIRNLGRTEVNARQLLELLRRVDQSRAVGDMITVNQRTVIHYKGQLDGQSIKNGLSATTNVYNQFLSLANKASGARINKLRDVIRGLRTNVTDFKDPNLFIGLNDLDALYEYSSEEFTGGWQINGEITPGRWFNNQRYKIDRVNDVFTTADLATPAPKPRMVENIILDTINLIKTIKYGRVVFRNIKNENIRLINEMDSLLNQLVNKEDDKDAYRVVASKFTKANQELLSKTVYMMNTLAYRTTVATLSYAKSVMKTYGL